MVKEKLDLSMVDAALIVAQQNDDNYLINIMRQWDTENTKLHQAISAKHELEIAIQSYLNGLHTRKHYENSGY